MKIYVECKYCGRKWDETIWSENELADKRCKFDTCKSRDLIVKDLTTEKVDYYKDPPKRKG